MENFGFSAPIGFGNGQVRALKHSAGAPSSCNKVYGEAKGGQILMYLGRIKTHLYQTSIDQIYARPG